MVEKMEKAGAGGSIFKCLKAVSTKKPDVAPGADYVR